MEIVNRGAWNGGQRGVVMVGRGGWSGGYRERGIKMVDRVKRRWWTEMSGQRGVLWW